MIDFGGVLVYATPLLFAALGESVTQRSGVLQIGLEGIMLSAAYAAAAVSAGTGSPAAGLMAGAAVGLLLAGLSGWLMVILALDQVVVGTALNLLALGATGALFRAQFAASQLPTVPKLPGAAALTVSMLLLALIPALSLVYRGTGWGLAVRAAGHEPRSVEAEGISAARLRMQAVLFGGMMAGLGGAFLSAGIAGSFAEGMTSGRGFLAIALVTFGRWNPYGIGLASLVFGYLETVPYQLQAAKSPVPYPLLMAMPYVLALMVLAVLGKGTRAPASLGKPLERSQ